MKELALKYLAHGWSVIPTGGGEDRKRPLVEWREFQTRLPTEEEVFLWWDKFPNADIAVVTGKVSNLTVLDIDREVHDDPNSSLPYFGDLPETLSTETGGGGVHLFYAYSERASKVASDGKGKRQLRNGIEIKSDGSIIKLPPSVHLSGKKYKTIKKVPIALFPETLIVDEMLVSRAKGLDISLLEGVGDGDRNTAAASLVGKLIQMNTPIPLMVTFMRTWNMRNEPPLADKDLLSTIRSISQTHASKHPQNPEPKKEYDLIAFDKLVERSMAELDATDGTECISTGYDWLDDQIVGLFKGELMVVGGETGLGKTTFVTNICYKASNRGVKTAVFALEDRLADYGIKAVYFELGKVRKRKGFSSNYPWNSYRKNEISDPEYKSIRAEAEKALKNDNLFFVDVPTQMNISSLERMVADFTAQGVKLFLIDHLHYFDMLREDKSKADYIEETMVRLKTLMNKTGARVILVVHYKKLEGKKPTVDSFKDSVSIPQNANYVINMWRDRSETGVQYETKFFMPKVRNPNGEKTITLHYDPEKNEYYDPMQGFGTPQGGSAKAIADSVNLD